MSRLNPLHTLILGCICLWLSACGQSGHLYLPTTTPSGQPTHTVLTTPLTPHPTNALEMNQNAQTLTSPNTNANAYPVNDLPQ